MTGHSYEQEEAWANVQETYNLNQVTGIRSLDEIKYIFEHLNKAAKNEYKNDKV